MKILIKILFIALLCLPFTLSAQWTDSGTYMRTNDNVGIGASGNTYTFYARTDKTAWQGRFANRGGAGADVYLAHGAGYGMHIKGRTTDGKYTLQLNNANVQTNVFYNNGNVGLGLVGKVGVGTTTPAEKLHVNGSVRGNRNGALRISTGNGYVDIGPKNTVWAHFTTDRGKFYFNKEIRVNTGFIGSYNQNLSLRTQGTTRMTILKSNGNVGIGTTTPNNKLDVNGTIRAKEIKVESGWSDYVFYEDYQLPTLEDEEKYIEENGHLLGFESEKAMDGEIQLGDVSRRQQAKIEEMMLHLIELKKEMTQLKEENEELKKLLKAEKE